MEKWGEKGGISKTAKLGHIAQHWLAELVLEEQRGITKKKSEETTALCRENP